MDGCVELILLNHVAPNEMFPETIRQHIVKPADSFAGCSYLAEAIELRFQSNLLKSPGME